MDQDWIAHCRVIACAILREIKDPCAVRVEETWVQDEVSPLPGYFDLAIATARLQAVGVANPVMQAELIEALEKTERAGDSLIPQSAAEYAAADRLASEWVAHE